MKKVFSKLAGLLGKKKKMVISIFVTAIVLLLIIAPIKKVDIGYQGVMYNSLSKDAAAQSISPGWHFVLPLVQDMEVYPVNEITYKIYRVTKTGITALMPVSSPLLKITKRLVSMPHLCIRLSKTN